MHGARDIAVKPLPGTSPEQALDARALARGFVWECFRRHETQKGGPATAPDDAMKGSKHDRATPIVPEHP